MSDKKGAAGKKKAKGKKKATEQEPLQPTLKGHLALVSAIDFYNETVLTGSWDRSCKAWDLKAMEEKIAFDGHTGNVLAVAIVNGTLWSAGLDKTIRSWDAKSGTCRDIIKMPSSVTALDFTTNNIFAACDDLIYSLDLKTKEVSLRYQGHTGLVSCIKVVEMDAAGGKLFSGSWDNTVKVFKLATAECIGTLKGHKDFVTCIAVQGQTLFSGSLDKTVVSWDVQAGTTLQTFACPDVPQCLAVDKNVILVGLQNGTTVMLDTRTFEAKHTFVGHSDAIRCIKLVEGGRFFTGSKDKTIKCWDLQDSTTKKPEGDAKDEAEGGKKATGAKAKGKKAPPGKGK